VALSPDNIEVQLPFSISVQHSLAGQDFSWERRTNKKSGGSTSYKDAQELIDLAKAYTDRVRDKDVESDDLPLIAYYGTGRLAREKHQKLAYAKQGSRLDGYYIALDPTTCKKRFLSWFKTFEDSKLKFNKDDALYIAFTNAITSMVPSWNKLHFSWELDDMIGQLNNEEWMPFSDLSDGYQNIIRLAADIAYRAVTLNPHLGEQAVVETEGVVLIDELDMHLHPTWQKNIIADLKKTFPKIQFIITTHSPFIVQSLKADEVLNLDENNLSSDPETLSLEENALFMGIEDSNSTKFSRKADVAEQYLGILNKTKSAMNSEKLKEMLLEFSDDPVFVAKLRMEGIKKQVS